MKFSRAKLAFAVLLIATFVFFIEINDSTNLKLQLMLSDTQIGSQEWFRHIFPVMWGALFYGVVGSPVLLLVMFGIESISRRFGIHHWMRQIIPPILLLALIICAWHYAVVGFGIKAFLVPKPSGVWQAAVENRAELFTAIGLTAGAALCGFASSLLIGSLTACVFSQSKMIRSSCYPYAIFLQTVPIVAVAPIIVVWFGAGFHSVVLVSFMISLFPIVTNVTTGMLAVDPDLLDLFRLYRATRWQVLWKLRLPHSVPFLIAGARTSSGMAVVGAIVGEFFAGNLAERHGLGYMILQGTQFSTAKLFAAVIASTLLGITIFGASTWIGSTVLSRWSEPKGREND